MIQFDELPESEGQYRAVQVAAGGQQVYPAYARVSAMPYNTVWPGGNGRWSRQRTRGLY